MAKVKHSQVFLKDKNILKKIVDHADIREDEWVLEIGPGKGYLTQFLLERGAKVIAIEVDKRLVEFLRQEFALLLDYRLFLFENDFLKIDLKEIFSKTGVNEIKVVSNIPYHITSPILEKLIRNKSYFPLIYLTLQKEVAERIIASPGGKEYGALTIFVNLHYNPELQFIIKKGSFTPAPKVDSAFLKLTRKKLIPVEDTTKFEKFVKLLFSSRRKKLRTILRNAGFKLERIEEQLMESLDRRPETFSLEELVKIFETVYKERNVSRGTF